MMYLRDRLGQVALVGFCLLFADAYWRHFRATGQFTALSYLTLMVLVVAMALVRRPTKVVATSWSGRIVATIGGYGSLLFRPGGTPLLPDWFTVGLTSAGMLIAIFGLFSLRRSFGVFAAHRGLVETGMYHLVRHPLYAGYVLGHVGFMLSSPTVWNLTCWVAIESSQLARIYYEEQLLSLDPQYVQYQQRVRWRLVPGVF